MRATSVAITVCSVILALGACRGSDKIVGSCDRRGSAGLLDKSTCGDVAQKVASDAKKACPSVGGTWSDKPCDRTGSVGGCKGANGTVWWFPTKAGSPPALADECESSDQIVGVDDRPLDAGSKSAPLGLTIDQAVKQYGAKAEAKLAAVEQIAKKLAPPPKSDSLKPEGARIQLHDKGGNVFLAYEEDLADVAHPANVKYRVPASTGLSMCVTLARKHSDFGLSGPVDIEYVMRSCAEAAYLAVIRITRARAPVVDTAVPPACRIVSRS